VIAGGRIKLPEGHRCTEKTLEILGRLTRKIGTNPIAVNKDGFATGRIVCHAVEADDQGCICGM